MAKSLSLDQYLPLDQYFENTLYSFILSGRVNMEVGEVTYWIMHTMGEAFKKSKQDFNLYCSLSSSYIKEMERIGVFIKGIGSERKASNGLMSYLESNLYKNSIKELKCIKSKSNTTYVDLLSKKLFDKSMSDLQMYI